MTVQQNKRRIAELWQAFGSRDVARIASFFHDDAVWIAPRNNATAVALGVTSGFTGATNIARFVAHDFHRLFNADASTQFRGLYADGDTAIVETTLRSTLSNGRHYENEYCFVFELAEGRIRTMREYMDTAKGYSMVFGADAPSRFGDAFAAPE